MSQNEEQDFYEYPMDTDCGVGETGDTIFVLDDGRHYNVQKKKFVTKDEISSIDVVSDLYNNLKGDGSLGGVDYLRHILLQANIELGDELKTIDELKDDRLVTLKEYVKNLLAKNTITYNGMTLDSGDAALNNIIELLSSIQYDKTLSNKTTEVEFCLADNNIITLTSDDLTSILTGIHAQRDAIRKWKWETRTNILAASSKEELDAIKLEFVEH